MDRKSETGESNHPWGPALAVNQDEFLYNYNQSFPYRVQNGERESNACREERIPESQEKPSDELVMHSTQPNPSVSYKRDDHSANDYFSHHYRQACRMQYAANAYHSDHHLGDGESQGEIQLQQHSFDKHRQQMKDRGMYAHPGQMYSDHYPYSNAYHFQQEAGYAGYYYHDAGTNPYWQYSGQGSYFAPPQYSSSTHQAFVEGHEERQDYRCQATAPAHRKPLESSVSRTAPLFMICDGESLSEYQCLIRKQIEIFSATSADIELTVQGRNRQIEAGQVGVRCRHCADIPIKKRARGAVYYPSKLSCIYQAAQNMTSVHLTKHCSRVPAYIRTELMKKDRKSSAGSGKEYWAIGARTLGVVEVDGRLWFAEDVYASKPRLDHYYQL